MAMSNRNTRAIHTDHKRTKLKLARHAEMMAELMAKGLTREQASRDAYRAMVNMERSK